MAAPYDAESNIAGSDIIEMADWSDVHACGGTSGLRCTRGDHEICIQVRIFSRRVFHRGPPAQPYKRGRKRGGDSYIRGISGFLFFLVFDPKKGIYFFPRSPCLLRTYLGNIPESRRISSRFFFPSRFWYVLRLIS